VIPRLRAAADSDAQDLFGLLTLCFAEYPGCYTDPHDDLPDLVKPGHWKERRGSDGRLLGGEFLVVEDERGRVSACIALDFPKLEVDGTPVAELHRLYVRPDRRGRGLAARLVAHVEAVAREAGARHMELWSDTRFETAHRLYERLGYARGGSRPLGDISNSTEFFFAKSL
jgi:putative acetyltransferase